MANYRVSIQLNGNSIETLQNILPQNEKLKMLFIGKVPTSNSVNEGHYFQGRQGTMFWNKLKKYSILNVPAGNYEDEHLLEQGYGIIDITKVPREYGIEPSSDEYIEGAKVISDVIEIYKPKIAVFIYKKVLDKLLEYNFNINTKSHYGFNNNLEELFGSKVFVFPMPGTPCNRENAHRYMLELKEVIDML